MRSRPTASAATATATTAAAATATATTVATATATALHPRLGKGCNPTHPGCNRAPPRYALWADEREARGEGGALPRLPQPLLERAAAAFAGNSEVGGSDAGGSDAGGSKAGISKTGDVLRRKAAAANSRSDGGLPARLDDSSLQLQVCSRAWGGVALTLTPTPTLTLTPAPTSTPTSISTSTPPPPPPPPPPSPGERRRGAAGREL